MMDTAFYQRSAATASRLLSRFGAPAVMHRSAGQGHYNPETGAVEGGNAQSWPCVVLIEDYSAQDIDGTLIQASDRRLSVAPGIAEIPKPGDVFDLPSGRVTAVRVMPLAPAGIAALYEVQARGE